MHRRARVTVTGVVVVALVFAGYFVVRSNNAGPASAASGPATFRAFYLAVGASSSLGFQPTGIAHHNGRRTSVGYANDLVLLERYRGVTLQLDQVGCPGDTVQSLLNSKVADHCYAPPETQLTKSVVFLHANHHGAGLVSIDLGFNNVRTCFSPTAVNATCVAQGVAAVRVDLPKILSALEAAAGPHVRFVGLQYYDPFLAYYLDGTAGPLVATASLYAMNTLNAALAQLYANAHVAVANVPVAFQTENSLRVPLANVGVIPQNVMQICQLTWMCYSTPFGPDDHPNEAGYSFIAQAIAAQLPPSW